MTVAPVNNNTNESSGVSNNNSQRTPRMILSGETLVLAECDRPTYSSNDEGSGIFAAGLASVSNRCISLQGRALLRLTKVSGSAGNHFVNGDALHVESGFGLVLRGHSLSKYCSWRSGKFGNEKGTFTIEGLPDGEPLQSQTPFRLMSLAWPNCYLAKEEKPGASGRLMGGDFSAPLRSHGCLVLSKKQMTADSSENASPSECAMYLCALPARLSFGQDARNSQIRNLLDRSLRREKSTTFAYVTQFRTVKSAKKKKRTVHMEKLNSFRSLGDSKHHDDAEGDIHDCSICLGGLEDGEEMVSLPCGGLHTFHHECIEQWLLQKSSCPMCVAPMEDLVSETFETAAPSAQHSSQRSPLLPPPRARRLSTV